MVGEVGLKRCHEVFAQLVARALGAAGAGFAAGYKTASAFGRWRLRSGLGAVGGVLDPVFGHSA